MMIEFSVASSWNVVVFFFFFTDRVSIKQVNANQYLFLITLLHDWDFQSEFTSIHLWKLQSQRLSAKQSTKGPIVALAPLAVTETGDELENGVCVSVDAVVWSILIAPGQDFLIKNKTMFSLLGSFPKVPVKWFLQFAKQKQQQKNKKSI